MLYPHYGTSSATGDVAAQDQAWAGGIMWAVGDLVFVIAIIAAVAVWLRHEDGRAARRRAPRAERSPDSARRWLRGPRRGDAVARAEAVSPRRYRRLTQRVE